MAIVLHHRYISTEINADLGRKGRSVECRGSCRTIVHLKPGALVYHSCVAMAVAFLAIHHPVLRVSDDMVRLDTFHLVRSNKCTFVSSVPALRTHVSDSDRLLL